MFKWKLNLCYDIKDSHGLWEFFLGINLTK